MYIATYQKAAIMFSYHSYIGIDISIYQKVGKTIRNAGKYVWVRCKISWKPTYIQMYINSFGKAQNSLGCLSIPVPVHWGFWKKFPKPPSDGNSRPFLDIIYYDYIRKFV